MSRMEPDLRHSQRFETTCVAGAWQYREQLSMLLVPMTARASSA